MYFNMRESNNRTMAMNYMRIFYSVFLICLHVYPSVSEDVKDLDYFAYSRNRMIPAHLVNVLSSFTGTLHQCAQTCRNSHQPSNINGTGNDNPGPCQAFEYIDHPGFCVLFNKKDNTGTSFDSLRPAAGTTFYEMAPSWSNLSLFIRTPKHVLSEDTAYYRLINSTTSEQCAQNCLDAPGIKCKSFAYSTNKKLCAFSKYDDNNHALIPAENYDFYRFRNDWPCNLTVGWKYATKVIASQGYPFTTNESYSCFVNIVPPKGKYVKLIIMELFVHHNLCHDTNAGITVYGVTNGPLRICSETNVTTFSGGDGDNVTVFLSQKNTPFVTMIHYEFEDINPCREYKCFNGGTCQTKHGRAVCLCSGNFTGHHCDVVISACSSSPCLFGGHCSANETGYKCTCLQGTTGMNCELFIGKCYTKPCRNGNCTIAATSTGFRCACAPGYTGTTCEYEINECFSTPCVYGECRDAVNGYICECREGFEGSNCEYKSGENDCRPSDCKFGTCAMNVSGSYCQCFPGFYGKLCELNINECVSSPCKHGKCIDHVNAYACACSPGFVGTHCDILLKNPCKINPCTNGYCSIDNGGFVCVCYKGFTGVFCKEIESTTPSSTSRSTTSITHPTTSHFNTIHLIKTHIPLTHAVFTTHSKASLKMDPSPTSTSTISVPSHVTLSIIPKISSTPNDLSTNARNVSSCNETKYCGAGTCLQTGGILQCLCPVGFKGRMCETKYSMCNRNTCVYGQCISGNFSDGSYNFNGRNSVCVCYQGYKGQNCDMALHNPHVNDTSLTIPTDSPPTNHIPTTHQSTLVTNVSNNQVENTLHNQISCDLLNPCKNYGACLKVNSTLQCVCRNPFTGVFCEVDMSFFTPEITITSSQANVLHTNVHITSTSLHGPDFRTTTGIPTTNASKTEIPPFHNDPLTHTAFTPQVTINVTKALYTATTHNYSTTLKTRISTTTDSRKNDKTNISTETHKVTPIVSTENSRLTGVDLHEHGESTLGTSYKEMNRSTKLTTVLSRINHKEQTTARTENTYLDINRESTPTDTFRNSKPTTQHNTEKSTVTDTVPKHIDVDVEKIHTTAEVTKTRSIPTTQVGELSRKTLAPVTTTISTTVDEKPVDESSNHVITFESALIGGLSVALLAVICVGAVIGYRRNRSGTVYISSPRSSMKVRDTTDNTAVKKRFSSRDIYVEQRNSRYNNPYYTQKCVTNQHRLTPRVKSATRSASSSTSDSPGRHSSNSTGEDYEQVQTESHVIQKESHVATHHSQSEESSSSTDNSFDRIIQRRRHSNDRLIRVTGNKAPPITHGSTGNTSSQQTRPHVPPFYQREDGSYVLNLNQSSSSVSPAEFHRVVDQLISSGKHKYTRPGTRQTVHQVSGVERGKSEA